MESRDEETLELKETYTSLQQEVDIKTKKLKKVGDGGTGSPGAGGAPSLDSLSSSVSPWL